MKIYKITTTAGNNYLTASKEMAISCKFWYTNWEITMFDVKTQGKNINTYVGEQPADLNL